MDNYMTIYFGGSVNEKNGEKHKGFESGIGNDDYAHCMQ